MLKIQTVTRGKSKSYGWALAQHDGDPYQQLEMGGPDIQRGEEMQRETARGDGGSNYSDAASKEAAAQRGLLEAGSR